MSPTGLQEFVDAETDPQERTIRKVAEAYREEQEGVGPAPARETRARRVAERPAPYAGSLEEGLRRALPADPEAARLQVEKMLGGPDAAQVKAAILRWIESWPPQGGPGKRRKK